MNLTIFKRDCNSVITLENIDEVPDEYMKDIIVTWEKEPSKTREFGYKIINSTAKGVIDIFGDEMGAYYGWYKDVI